MVTSDALCVRAPARSFSHWHQCTGGWDYHNHQVVSGGSAHSGQERTGTLASAPVTQTAPRGLGDDQARHWLQLPACVHTQLPGALVRHLLSCGVVQTQPWPVLSVRQLRACGQRGAS